MLTWAALLLGFVAGSALQLQQQALWYAGIYLCFLALALVYIAWPAIKNIAIVKTAPPLIPAAGFAGTATSRCFVLMLAGMCLGFALCGLRSGVFLADALDPQLQGRDIQVVGIVAAMPQKSETGLRFRLAVESAQWGNTAVTLPPQLLLSWYSGVFQSEDSTSVPYAELQRGSDGLRAGERWAFTVRLKSPHGNANPHGFDYELWLWEQGLQATGYIRATPKDLTQGTAPRLLGTTWQHPVERARQQVRDAIFRQVPEPRLAGVLAALVVGDQAAIDRADWDVYRATGVAHLMSISGLHVTMFAWVAALLVGRVWRSSRRAMLAWPAQHAAATGGLLLAIAYAVFSGWGVPAQRTIWMLATVVALRLLGKRWPWPMVWLLSCAVVVLVDPWALLQAGFWLSFIAVAVLFASDVSLPTRDREGPGQDAADQAKTTTKRAATAWLSIKNMLREQWIVTVALTPLALLLFHQVSVVGLVANAVAIPWITLVVTPLAMLGILIPPLWSTAAASVEALGWLLQWFSSWPFATFSVAASPWWISALAVLGGILCIAPAPWALRCTGLPLVLPVLLFVPPVPAVGHFELLAADVGQGNALIVRTASHSLLFDAGPRFSRESDAGQRTLVPLLRALGVRLDTVVLSHRDTDHIGGALAVLGMQPQAALLSSMENEHVLQQTKRATRCIAGQRWTWDGVEFAFLHPQEPDYAVVQKPNAMSCVLRISNGQQTALLTGDIEAAQEARLVAAAAADPHMARQLQADVLLVPHHGSKTSSTDAFLDAVQPRIALVQAGYRNRFSHPAPEVAARYTQRGITLLDSPRCGAATWRSAQPLAYVCQRQVAPKYWQHRMDY